MSAELDARMLTDLRQWRATESVKRKIAQGQQVWLDADELDMLLRVADERDELKRQACEMPDERPSNVVDLPAGHALIGGKVVPLAPPHPGVMHIAGAGGVLCGAKIVSHVTDGRRYADCPACIEVFESKPIA